MSIVSHMSAATRAAGSLLRRHVHRGGALRRPDPLRVLCFEPLEERRLLVFTYDLLLEVSPDELLTAARPEATISMDGWPKHTHAKIGTMYEYYNDTGPSDDLDRVRFDALGQTLEHTYALGVGDNMWMFNVAGRHTSDTLMATFTLVDVEPGGELGHGDRGYAWWPMGAVWTPLVGVAASVPTTKEPADEQSNSIPGRFTVTRDGNAGSFVNADPLTIYLRVSGAATRAKDYDFYVDGTLLTAGGTGDVLTVTFPGGVASLDVWVRPKHDDKPEGTENVVLTVIASDWYDPAADSAQRQAVVAIQNRTQYEIVATDYVYIRNNRSRGTNFQLLKDGDIDTQKGVTAQVAGGIAGDSAVTNIVNGQSHVVITAGAGNPNRFFIVNLIVDDEKHAIGVEVE